ncbi:hypothetical protein LguiA_033742 [Lonicera macranthoides]
MKRMVHFSCPRAGFSNLESQIDLIEASQSLKFYRSTIDNRKPNPPSINRFTLNRYKKIEDAFRPTSPGHSPGVGHHDPPGAP